MSAGTLITSAPARSSASSSAVQEIVLTVPGTGPLVVNVDGPEAPAEP